MSVLHYPSVEMCPLCETLRPQWCENFGKEGHTTLVGIPVCIPCGWLVQDYMNKLGSDEE